MQPVTGTPQALCLCGHAFFSHYISGQGGCNRLNDPGDSSSGCLCPGFSLDYRLDRADYARSALTGLLANTEYQHRQGATVAEEAFDYAEAMLAEAKKRDTEPSK